MLDYSEKSQLTSNIFWISSFLYFKIIKNNRPKSYWKYIIIYSDSSWSPFGFSVYFCVLAELNETFKNIPVHEDVVPCTKSWLGKYKKIILTRNFRMKKKRHKNVKSTLSHFVTYPSAIFLPPRKTVLSSHHHTKILDIFHRRSSAFGVFCAFEKKEENHRRKIF